MSQGDLELKKFQRFSETFKTLIFWDILFLKTFNKLLEVTRHVKARAHGRSRHSQTNFLTYLVSALDVFKPVSTF